jgi:hypothetical protein
MVEPRDGYDDMDIDTPEDYALYRTVHITKVRTN